jgi:pimeloyl-ACP methyl ester carboxylesterase
MKIGVFLIQFLITSTFYATEITPYKYADTMPCYEIPASSQFMVNRSEVAAPDVISYFSPPKSDHYPIAILCGGSSSPHDIQSIIHFHRYFLQEFLDLSVGVITLEQRGVRGNKIDAKEFMEHYTRSNRLKDHQIVMNYLIRNPPKGWNGNFIFLGVSEGGPIVTSLTEEYSDKTLATINWSGAVDWSWREQLWLFLQKLIADNPECPHQLKFQDCEICSEHMTCRSDYDDLMEATLVNSRADQYFLGMTYRYHADAMLYPAIDYQKMRTPFLVVTGAEDPIIHSSDAFVEKAKDAGVNVTYLRVEGMDHYVRKRPDIIDQSFEWLKDQLANPQEFSF